MFGEPCGCAVPEVGSDIRVFGAQGLHAGGETLGVEFIDGEGTVATLGTAGAADEPGSRAARRFGKSGVHDLHEFAVARGKDHAGKDTGFDCSARRFPATLVCGGPL